MKPTYLIFAYNSPITSWTVYSIVIQTASRRRHICRRKWMDMSDSFAKGEIDTLRKRGCKIMDLTDQKHRGANPLS